MHFKVSHDLLLRARGHSGQKIEEVSFNFYFLLKITLELHFFNK